MQSCLVYTKINDKVCMSEHIFYVVSDSRQDQTHCNWDPFSGFTGVGKYIVKLCIG